MREALSGAYTEPVELALTQDGTGRKFQIVLHERDNASHSK